MAEASYLWSSQQGKTTPKSRYGIQEQLGVSALATSYKGYDYTTKSTVVIKVLNPQLYQSSTIRQQIYQRLQQLAVLNHPHILPITDISLRNNRLYWVMPYVGKESLHDKVQRGQALSQVRLRAYLMQITAALGAAHQQGIVHGNLKPTNILISHTGHLLVSDFGLLDTRFQRKKSLDYETVLYLAPEQFTHPHLKATIATDMYALGVILFIARTGEPPYDAATMREVAHKHIHAPIPTVKMSYRAAWSHFFHGRMAVAVYDEGSAEFQPILNQTLTKNPQHRYPNMQALQDVLNQLSAPVIPKTRRWLFFVLAATCILMIGMLWQLRGWVGASAADPLRSVVGNQRVAQIEEAVFQIQDQINQTKVELGVVKPEAPWSPPITVTPTVALPTPRVEPLQDAVLWENSPHIDPMGSLEQEGVWLPYLYNREGTVVSRRTFLQPDPERPLTILAVVAIDLQQTRLNYAFGTEEPTMANGGVNQGVIRPADKIAGHLLATFNSGFKSTHGNFGAMNMNQIAIAPRNGLGTVTIDQEGIVDIGTWGTDFSQRAELVAYRQNAQLIVSNGGINPNVYNNSIADWGGTVDYNSVTWRSALGLSEDRQTLYYMAGSSLSMPVLAQAAIHIGAFDTMLLDINPYWVHFAAVAVDSAGEWGAAPLFEEEMSQHADRYLRPSKRDFFYLTLK